MKEQNDVLSNDFNQTPLYLILRRTHVMLRLSLSITVEQEVY